MMRPVMGLIFGLAQPACKMDAFVLNTIMLAQLHFSLFS
uniref:Uncharacterized protein n=1 Tax=Rhizophora mucronata TaxID=61149 RepID=A0A2P2NNE4_RHIMU